MRYLKEFSQWRKRQSQEIVVKQDELAQQQVRLDSLIAERKSVIEFRTQEANQLKGKKREKNEFVTQLRKNEKSLRKEADKQRARINKLNKQIDDIIAEEARKAAERARAEAEAEAKRLAAEKAASQGEAAPKVEEKKESEKKKSDSKSTKSQYQMTRADRELSGSFEKNKGKLPFPIQGQYRIVGHFGLQKHPEFKYLDKNNLGIDIETTPGTKARAIFDGEVARVFSFGGAEKAVMIRHGNYYTVYTGLIEVYVKAGDKVKIRQDLGVIYSDPKDNNRTRLSFQIRKEMEKLNPELWLDI
jgi:septal ring factor EnvC (AmiA/AmiB activator)